MDAESAAWVVLVAAIIVLAAVGGVRVAARFGLPGLLFYLLISVFVFVGCRGLRRRTSDRGLLRFAVGAFLVVSALGAVFAALVYIMAAPLAQPDMVDFYRMYRPGALIFLLGLFIIQFVFGVAAVYRGK